MNTENGSFQSEDGELVRIASNGDLEAFNQLVIRYQNLAYNLASNLLADPDLAEDATQEGFIKAFQALPTFRGGSFRAWLLRIVANTCYDLLRRSKKHPVQPLIPEDDFGEEIDSTYWLADPSASVQETVEQNEEAERLYRMLDELSPLYRSAITLVDLYELDYSEAARVLSLPVGTVKSRLARARLQIRDKLKPFIDFGRNPASVSASCAA